MDSQYYRPESLDTALDWLIANNGTIAAGCTDLLPATSAQALLGPVLDLTGIAALRGISEDEKSWAFGATTTWTDLIRADLPPAFDSLKLAAREVGSIQIQNAGTLAGNLCNASPAADGVPCWLTLDAEVELASKAAKRRIPLSEFITGPRRTELCPGEIVSAIIVPKSASTGRSSFLKLGARKYLIISIAMVAVRLEVREGKVVDAAISVGSCNAVAQRLYDVERFLMDRSLTGNLADSIPDQMIAGVLDPIDDLRSDANYRVAAAIELVRRCIASIELPKELAV